MICAPFLRALATVSGAVVGFVLAVKVLKAVLG
jgi:hypothetical protein